MTALDTFETSHQVIFRSPGTVSNFAVNLTVNNITASSTFRFRINAANGNQLVTPGATTTGYFEDTTNTDSITAGNLISVQGVPGDTTNTYTINLTDHHFSATTDTVTRLVVGAMFSTSNASVTKYCQLNGNFADFPTESFTKCRMRKAGTIKNGAVNVPTNGKTGTTTFQTRKSGANGNVVVTFAASATGIHEDTTNSDAVVIGNDFNWSIAYGAGASNIAIYSIACDFINTAGFGQAIAGRTSGNSFVTGASSFLCIGGTVSNQPTESIVQIVVRAAFSFSELNVNVLSNSTTAAGKVTLRNNGANTALVATLTAGTVALFSDTTDSVAFAIGNKVNWNSVTGTGGSTTITDIIASTTVPPVTIGQTVFIEWEE